MVKPGEIHVKDSKILRGLMIHRSDRRKPILADIITYVADTYGVVITEFYRDPRHAQDLHGTRPVRAVDLRTWCYPNPQAIVDDINDKWSYDPTRPHKKVAIIHDVGMGKHFHIQVHPNTVAVDV